MKARIIAVSDSDKHFAEPIQEYIKRLGKMVEVLHIKPHKYGTKQQIVEKETDKVLKYLSKQTRSCYTVMLSICGSQMTSEQFTHMCVVHTPLQFIMGGPYGLNEKRLAPYVKKSLSFGQETLPHGLAKLVLLEQIYRATTIQQGKSYHY